jgi:hypothetical protein
MQVIDIRKPRYIAANLHLPVLYFGCRRKKKGLLEFNAQDTGEKEGISAA